MSLEFGRHSQYLSVSILLGGEEGSAFLSDGGWRRPRSGLQPSPWSLPCREGGHQGRPPRGPRQLLAAPSQLALGRRPPALSPAPSACGGGRSPVFLSGDPASQSSGVLPPKLPAPLCPRPPLLQPRLGRLPGRLLQALFYPKELGGGREQVPDVRRAPRQHQHARGTGLHQQWAGDREGGDPSSPVLSATHSLTHHSVS